MRVHEMFESISGEAGGYPQGTWISGIRLQGCNLRCSYCDTTRSQDEMTSYTELTPSQIMELPLQKHVLITGGEPLLQDDTVGLIASLLRNNHIVQVETNGSIQIPVIRTYRPIHWVVDRKCPSSGMVDKMPPLHDLLTNIKAVEKAGSLVYLKWVVDTEEDIEYMINEIQVINMFSDIVQPCIISPIHADGTKIPEIINALKEKAGNRFEGWMENITISVQLHKICDMP